ncbi:MAG: ATP synthase F0 subunit B [Candidatus Binatia bacterium]
MLVFPPDFTLVIQLLSFFVLFFILNKLLFVPFAELLVERESRTEGAEKSAEESLAAAERMKADIETQITEARVAALAEAEKLRRTTREEEVAIFESAKSEATAELAQLREGISRERENAAQTLRSEAQALADGMVAAVLGA